ncbi:MAG: hypothetical protein D6790_18220 [Caldilineae bacterium]|nr:MAG: hypothetical protein D6790_18220 [Caldilineae bacterium]
MGRLCDTLARAFGLPEGTLPEDTTTLTVRDAASGEDRHLLFVPGVISELEPILGSPGLPSYSVVRTKWGEPGIAVSAFDAGSMMEKEHRIRAELILSLRDRDPWEGLHILKSIEDTARRERDEWKATVERFLEEARGFWGGWYVRAAVKEKVYPEVPVSWEYFPESHRVKERFRKRNVTTAYLEELEALCKALPRARVLAGEMLMAWYLAQDYDTTKEVVGERMRALSRVFPAAVPEGGVLHDPVPHLLNLVDQVKILQERVLLADAQAAAAELLGACIVAKGKLPPAPTEEAAWLEKPKGGSKLTERQKKIVRQWFEEELERALDKGMSAPKEAAYAAVAERLALHDIEVSPRTVRRWRTSR